MRQGPNGRRGRGGRPHPGGSSNGGSPRSPQGGGMGGGNRQPRSAASLRHQSFDSNGPDVRVRGNAWQVFEKYQALARDAQAAGDRVAAENYFQHAEHYYRIIEAINEATLAEQRARGFTGPTPEMTNGMYAPPVTGEGQVEIRGNLGFATTTGVAAPVSAPVVDPGAQPQPSSPFFTPDEAAEDNSNQPQAGVA